MIKSSVYRNVVGVVAGVGLCVSMLGISDCAPGEYRREADEVALDIIQQKQMEAQAKALIANGTTPDPDRLGDAAIPLKELG